MLTVLIQKELLRGVAIPETDELNIIPFSSEDNWKEKLAKVDNTTKGPYLVHCSIQIAKWLLINYPETLGSGVSLPGNIHAHQQVGRLGEFMLNSDCLFLPFGRIKSRKDMLFSVFGNDLFLRPDSAFKVFSGRPVPKDMFDIEISSLQQIEHIFPDELCQIARLQRFSEPEWRCWMIDGEMVISAAYAFEKEYDKSMIPGEDIRKLSECVAEMVIDIDNLMVVDIVYDENNTAKVMELNGFSTSGFYPGVDIEKLWLKSKEIFL